MSHVEILCVNALLLLFILFKAFLAINKVHNREYAEREIWDTVKRIRNFYTFLRYSYYTQLELLEYLNSDHSMLLQYAAQTRTNSTSM